MYNKLNKRRSTTEILKATSTVSVADAKRGDVINVFDYSAFLTLGEKGWKAIK